MSLQNHIPLRHAITLGFSAINSFYYYSEYCTDKSFIHLHFSFQVEINHANEIKEIFDAISYRKGASIIRMLQTYLGPECLQVGLLVS